MESRARFGLGASLVAAGLAALAAPSQAETVGLSLKKGDVFSWTHKIRKSTVQKSAAPTVSETATPYTMRVVDVAAKGYVVEFQHGRTTFDAAHAAAAAADARTQALLKLVEEARIRVELDKDGEFGALVNLPEIKATVEKIVASVAASTPGAESQATAKFLQDLFGTEQGIKTITLKDAPSLFLCVGLDPSAAPPPQDDVELPNPFGGAPLDAKQNSSIHALPNAPDMAEAQVLQQVNKESYIKAIADFGLKSTGKPMPPEALRSLQDAVKDGAVRLEMHATCNVKTGVSQSAEVVNVVSLPGQRQETKESFVASP